MFGRSNQEGDGLCVWHVGERRDAYRALVGRPEGKRTLGRPGRRWEGNIKIDLQKVELEDWTALIWFKIGTGGGLLLTW